VWILELLLADEAHPVIHFQLNWNGVSVIAALTCTNWLGQHELSSGEPLAA